MLDHATCSLQTGRWPDYLSFYCKMCPVTSLGQVPPCVPCPVHDRPFMIDLSQVANQPSDQLTHKLCTLCLVYMCKGIHNHACHSGAHHLVPSRHDPLQGGVEVVLIHDSKEGGGSVERAWLCSQNLTSPLLSVSSKLCKLRDKS